MPELILSRVVEEWTPAFYISGLFKEVRPIVTGETTYQDLIGMFGSDYEMPPEADFTKGDEYEYRCSYFPKCPTGAKCFVVSTPEPLQEKDVLNVSCRLMGKKIPVYAGKTIRRVKK